MLKTRWRKIIADIRGVSTIEFAITIPLIVFGILYGGFESWQMISAALRVNRAASHVSTVAARADATLSEGALTSLLESANTIAVPTELLSGGRVILSAVQGGPGGKILWQRCRGDKTSFTSNIGVPGAVPNLTGNSLPVPPAGTTALVAETFYEYHLFLSGSMLPVKTLGHTSISLGREEVPDVVIASGVPSPC